VNEPIWLDSQDLYVLQNQMLARFGGLEGIRDKGLLESALYRPVQKFQYEPKSTLPELAASYSYGIARNHPFFDGNKRSALLAAIVFLGINGMKFHATEEEAVLETLALAAGERTEEEYAFWLTKNST
jgi:death-on-curing protein|tara:strand:+ start:96 stop:479 length:384 start_codon:yes stop_codon:yes gene_type:complete